MPSPFTSKHIEKEREWVDHSPDASKHVETKWGGLNPSPPPSRWPNRSDEEGFSLLVTSLRTCQRVENKRGGVEPSLFASKRVESGQKETGRGGALPIC